MTVCAKEREGGAGNGDKPAAVRVTITAAVMIETRTPMPMARNHERPSRSCAMVAHSVPAGPQQVQPPSSDVPARKGANTVRSEEHTSELQSLMRISYAVFCLKKKNTDTYNKTRRAQH